MNKHLVPYASIEDRFGFTLTLKAYEDLSTGPLVIEVGSPDGIVRSVDLNRSGDVERLAKAGAAADEKPGIRQWLVINNVMVAMYTFVSERLRLIRIDGEVVFLGAEGFSDFRIELGNLLLMKAMLHPEFFEEEEAEAEV